MTDLERKIKELSEALEKVQLSSEELSELLQPTVFEFTEKTKEMLNKLEGLRNVGTGGYKSINFN